MPGSFAMGRHHFQISAIRRSGWASSPSCVCGGNCMAVGAFTVENAVFTVTGGVCRCGFDDPFPDGPPSYDGQFEPSLTISFSRPAVIFENDYLNTSTGSLVRAGSTRTMLTISAYGGLAGGTLTLSADNLDRCRMLSRMYMILFAIPLPNKSTFHLHSSRISAIILV